ncbi:MAG: PEP-CTERM sorting domain-containing protein [Pirellulales bacterium]|nr:PEP-CTERM sorting domain-containing protein [Pirellulales bacterium]
MWHKLNGMIATAAIASVVFFGLLGGRSSLSVTYTAVDLSPTAVTRSYAIATIGTQQIGYGSGTATGGNNHALLWNGTAQSALDLNPNGFTSSFAIGTCGTQQVGSGLTATGSSQHALLWENTASSAVDLNPSTFKGSYASDTNGTQQVGHGWGTVTGGYTHALLWSGTANSATDLNPSGFTESYAKGISDTQQVGAGYGTVTGNKTHALLWNSTAASAVDLNPSGFTQSWACAISGSQQIGYGSGTVTGNKTHALLWSDTADSALDLTPNGFDFTTGQSTNGTQQVGWGNGTATNLYNHALLWSGTADSAVDLHQFLPGEFTDSHAKAIDAQGNIVGYAYDTSHNEHAILWIPVPEPSMFALLGMGAFGLLAWVWRRGRGAVLFATPKICVAFVLLTPAIGYSNPITELGLTIDVTGPGGLGVKEVPPGPITGEIWATVKGLNLNFSDEKLSELTGGLRISGGGSFLPFDVASNYLPPWDFGAIYPVDLSPDGKTLGHGGLTSKTGTGVLWFRSPVSQVGNEPFKVGTFQANLEAGDSIQFMLSGRSVLMYVFTVDNAVRNGATGYDLNLIHVGEPLVVVPEPSTFVLLGLGVFGLLGWCWRRVWKAGD